jgi:hypothetical protein
MMELSAVAPRITHLRHVMKVIVQIQESVTQLSVVRMRPASEGATRTFNITINQICRRGHGL